MKLSLELLFSYMIESEPELQDCFELFSPPDVDFTVRRISRIRFLTDTDKLLEKDTLWFVNNIRLTTLSREELDGRCIISCADASEVSVLEDSGCICIVPSDNICMMRMFNSFMEFFRMLEDWRKDSEIIIARKEPVQKLLERAEPIIKNPVFMWDGSFNIIGHPTYDVPEMPLWQKWLELGYIPGDGVAQFAKLGYFNNSHEYNSLHPITPLLFNYPFVLRVFSEGMRQEVVMAQYFTKLSCTPALLEMLNILEDMLRLYVDEVMKTGKREKNLIYEPFIADVIQGRYTEDEIKDKLKYIKLPFEAKYIVYAVSFERYTKPLAVYAKRALKQLFPGGHAIELNHTVYLLSRAAAKDEQAETGFNEKLLEVLENSSCFCGVSNEVNNLYEVKAAATQSLAAIRMGNVIQPEKRCWLYQDIYAYNVLYCYYQHIGMDSSSIIYPGLETLIRNDAENNNDNLKLLDIFLNNDRNITNTAKEMFLHRNTVIYRIGKIEQILGASLDDPKVRFDLLLSLKYIELKSKMEKHGELLGAE